MPDATLEAGASLTRATLAANDLAVMIDVSQTGVARNVVMTIQELLGAGWPSSILEPPPVTAGAGTNQTIHGANAFAGSAANGGDVVLLPGTKDGAGLDGNVVVRQPGGTPGTHEVRITHDGTNAVQNNRVAAGTFQRKIGGTTREQINSDGTTIKTADAASGSLNTFNVAWTGAASGTGPFFFKMVRTVDSQVLWSIDQHGQWTFGRGSQQNGSGSQGKILSLLGNNSEMLSITGFAATGGTDVQGSTFGPITIKSQSNQNVALTPNGTGIIAANGIIEFPQVAAGGTPATNSARLYAKDVAGTAEIFVKDEAGNETQISPHAFDAPASLYDTADEFPHVIKEINFFVGKVRYLNVSRFIRMLQLLLNSTNTLVQLQALPVGQRQLFIVEDFATHNTRTGENLVQDTWQAAQDRLQAAYDNATALEQSVHDQWAALNPTDRASIPEPVIRPAINVRKVKPAWLASRGF
jgi:hypothetical protein